jgi:hypothetical protein
MQKQNRHPSATRLLSALLAVLVFMPLIVWHGFVSAASPSGNNWFEIHSDPFTGKDDSGDGGTGNPADFNYFYVGQTFTANTSIKSIGTNAANMWVDYDPALIQPNNLGAGTYYNHSAGLTVNNGRIKATGYNFPNAKSTGLGNFMTFKAAFAKPSAANYGTGTPALLHFNLGTIGATTESNIALNGTDLLNSAKDFRFHVWADTKKPYALSPQPANAATNVPVTSNFAFQLRDSLHGEGDNTGVGTGVNMNSAQAQINAIDSTGTLNLKPNSLYTCSGIWGSNVCDVTVTPSNLTAFAGDTRKWKYGTSYTISISNYEDLASSNQGQLGDSNGPNRMDPKTYTFTTEADTVAPQILNPLPVSDSMDLPLNTAISFDIEDRKTYPGGMSGSGVAGASCQTEISSKSFGDKTYKVGDPEVTATAKDYGFHYAVDPATDFGSNETVTVRLFNCEDLAGNKAQDKVFVFKTLVVDTDKDGILDAVDNCPLVPNTDQKDTTKAWHDLFVADPVKYAQYATVVASPLGDACNPDLDGDTIPNATDNCPLVINTDQKDTTKAWHDLFVADPVKYAQYKDVVPSPLGDACNPDLDGDGIPNEKDNCPLVPNTDQKNTTNELHALYLSDPVKYASYKDIPVSPLGDACNPDIDGDGIPNEKDNCPTVYNPDQADVNKNGIGDACEGGLTLFNITAKPQKRVHTAGNPNLGMTATLTFYNTLAKAISLQDTVTFSSDGTATYSTTKLNPGTYNIGLKGEAHLTRVIRGISVTNGPVPVSLDYTFGGTTELIAGDIQSEDKINSFDIVRILKVYGFVGTQVADLVKDGRVSAPDIALLIMNYLKKGESLQ